MTFTINSFCDRIRNETGRKREGWKRMAYCEKCGHYIANEMEGCTYCKNNIGGTDIEGQNKDSYNYQQPGLSNGAKVAMVAVTILIPGIGYIFGVIMSIVYMSKPDFDSKSFGKALMILCVVMIIISILCCIIMFIFNIALFDAIDQNQLYNQMGDGISI